jgi:branched-chain amino acid transport system substrate-binding protein
MRRLLSPVLGAALALAAAAVAASTASADTIKVGVIGAYSGPFTTFGKNFKAGVEAYLAVNGNKAGNHTIEVIYRDLDGIAPPKAKTLAQDLVVKDKVQYLAGVVFTPNAMAIAEILEEANVPFVIFNAATSAITTKSPYVVRTSFTLWQNAGPMGKVAAEKGFKNVITMVSDYGPGHDAEAAFKKMFEAAGGKVVESVRMPPPTTDFTPFMQRARDSGAQAVFAFLPAGPPTLSFAKAFNTSGMKGKIELLTTGDLTQESDLPALGADGVGILSTFHYSVAHPGKANEAFVAAAQKALGADAAQLTFPAVAAFDGMKVIAEMIKATDGKQDAKKAVEAVKGMAWESPRGPVKIDPNTRHVTQNIYLRVVEKAGDKFVNKEIATYPNTPDLGLASQ